MIFMKISKKELKAGLKTIGGMLAMVALGVIANSLNVPVKFSIGGGNINNNVQSSTSTAQKAIESIMKSVEQATYQSEIQSAADDIYNIARENRYDEEVTSYAVAVLGTLTNKASLSSTRTHIVGLIKEIATF